MWIKWRRKRYDPPYGSHRKLQKVDPRGRDISLSHIIKPGYAAISRRRCRNCREMRRRPRPYGGWHHNPDYHFDLELTLCGIMVHPWWNHWIARIEKPDPADCCVTCTKIAEKEHERTRNLREDGKGASGPGTPQPCLA